LAALFLQLYRCWHGGSGAGTPLESRVADMRAAIIRYWLLNMRGGEKVVEVPCRTQPEYDLFTLF
jgi:hypothetical protein